MTAEHLGADVRDKLAAAVAGGLAASGADVVDSAATTKGAEAKGIRGCETPTCRIAIAEATGARYLMRGSVETMGRSYTVHLEMIDGTTGTVIGVREDRCEICTENEAYETASMTASALKAEVVKRPTPVTGGADGTDKSKIAITDVTYPPNKDAPGATLVSVSGSTLPGSEPPRLRPWAWAAIGAGAAAIGGGIYILAIDGQQKSCMRNGPNDTCPRTWDMRGWGITSITGGALAAVLGATLLAGRF